jgi:DNA primase
MHKLEMDDEARAVEASVVAEAARNCRRLVENIGTRGYKKAKGGTDRQRARSAKE